MWVILKLINDMEKELVSSSSVICVKDELVLLLEMCNNLQQEIKELEL